MVQVSLADRFHGSCCLIVWHLRRAAHSNDLEAGFSAARDMNMLTPEKEAFVRHCLALDERIQQGQEVDEPLTNELIRDLQACTISLNTADPA